MSEEKQATPQEDLIRSLWQEAPDLIRRLEGSSVQRLSVQAGEYKIEIERGAPTVAPTPAAVPQGAAGTGATPADTTAATAEATNRFPIVAPLVGTYYGAAQPGAKPFVEEGDVVDKGQTVCIVEAMKIMNQVQADRPGRVVEILVKDGEWVE